MTSAGFEDVRFRGAGGYPYLWKSMVFAGVRPTSMGPVPRTPTLVAASGDDRR